MDFVHGDQADSASSHRAITGFVPGCHETWHEEYKVVAYGLLCGDHSSKPVPVLRSHQRCGSRKCDSILTSSEATGAAPVTRTSLASADQQGLPTAAEFRELVALKNELNQMYREVAATRTSEPPAPQQ
jgi:hypothetical protein